MDGQATSTARFGSLRGLALHTNGALYATDSINNLVRVVTTGGLQNIYFDKVDKTSGCILGAMTTTLAGSTSYATTRDGIGSNAGFNRPYGISVDTAGVVFVSEDTGKVIRMILTSGREL